MKAIASYMNLDSFSAHISLIVHVDEFQAGLDFQDSEHIGKMYSSLCNFLSQHSYHLHTYLFPVFTGTAPVKVAETVYISKHRTRVFHLTCLALASSKMLLWSELKKRKPEYYKQLLKSVVFESLIDQAIGDMGGIPRFLEYLLDYLCSVELNEAVFEYVNKVLKKVLQDFASYSSFKVMKRIPETYQLDLWEKLLGGSQGVRYLIMYGLSGVPVN